MESWFDVVTPRTEVLAGRSFRPDEFAIALEQVVSGTAPDDYRQPEAFLDRTCFTGALTEHARLVLRRLAGETQDSAPVLSLISGFGGGKTHTLTTLFHLARGGAGTESLSVVRDVLTATGLVELPRAAVGVFVGNAWDPRDGCETPWIDLARQIAGDAGVAALGPAVVSSPPGTDALGRLLQAAGKPVLILCDEVINFTARHEALAEGFLAFLHNLTVTLTGTSRAVAVISLPQNAVEMTERDQVWHQRITKVVRRVARDLGTGQGDIAEIVRRRLFEDCGSIEARRDVTQAYAEWCVKCRDRLPAEWSGDATTLSNEQLLNALTGRFLASYPFHPTLLSVFKRKWSGLPQFQQTRGALAILARWVAEAFERRERAAVHSVEPFITLASAPLHDTGFRRTAAGQLGTDRVDTPIDADIVRMPGGTDLPTRAETLDAESEGPLSCIHQRVATAIWFESAGGTDGRFARLSELRLAAGHPEIDTTTVDTAALSVESAADFIHATGRDGFRFGHRPKIDRAVRERRASLDDDRDVQPELCRLITEVFQPPAIAAEFFPDDGADVADRPRLTLVVADPDDPWTGDAEQRRQLADRLAKRGASPRLYPGGLLWCFRQPGTALKDSVASALAWRQIAHELAVGTIGAEFEPGSLDQVADRVAAAELKARDEARSAYQTVVMTDRSQPGTLRVVNVGCASGDSVALHIVTALRDAAVISDSVGAGYLKRVWPPAFRDSGLWPLASLRQSFFDGALTRLLDAETALREAIQSGVSNGEFGLVSGPNADGTYDRVRCQEPCPTEVIQFDAEQALLDSTVLRASPAASSGAQPRLHDTGDTVTGQRLESANQLSIKGSIPPEQWNRVGTKILARLKSAGSVTIDVSITADYEGSSGEELAASLRLTLDELGISDRVEIRCGESR